MPVQPSFSGFGIQTKLIISRGLSSLTTQRDNETKKHKQTKKKGKKRKKTKKKVKNGELTSGSSNQSEVQNIAYIYQNIEYICT